MSNRLPVTVTEKRGELRFTESVGGLSKGLSAYLDYLKNSQFIQSEYIWIGWPGISANDEKKKKIISKGLSRFNAYPVFISESEMEKFYHGFCNKTIWPLFHYFPSYAIFNEDYWRHYIKVNEIFCETLLKIIKPDDVIWIHDYHLMLLPKLIREKMPTASIGFFLHIPFSDFELFRMLPAKWRRELLEGMLGADLVGFHTHDYTQYFLRSVLRILGHEHNMGTLVLEDRLVKVDTFPMGIDFQRFYNALNLKEVQKEVSHLREKLKDLKVILSIDRLDYTKGILNRLHAYEIFLERNPKWRGKVILLIVVVPSRIGVEHYKMMKSEIDRMVGNINGKFGKIDWTPILYQYRYLPFDSLTAVYSVSDVALITPLRDGMNLIAKEYIATKVDRTGVLVLSEMAGASYELGEAIIVNPNKPEEIASALTEALEMDENEKRRRIEIMQTRLKRYNVVKWADDFIQSLLSTKKEQGQFEAKMLGSYKEELISSFQKANRRVVFLDYDGTLVPFAEYPHLAKPTEDILKILDPPSKDERNDVVVVSGRDKKTLESYFGMLNVGLIAEHGAWIKKKKGEWRTLKPLVTDFKSKILPLLELYVDRVPGSFIEEKEFSIVWHYRRANSELASIRVKELVDNLVNFTANMDVQILHGNKVVEIREAGVNKGTAALSYLEGIDFDFILAIGDDWTDEDLFKILPETAYSIRIGMAQSHAKFNLRSHRDVIELLKKLRGVEQ